MPRPWRNSTDMARATPRFVVSVTPPSEALRPPGTDSHTVFATIVLLVGLAVTYLLTPINASPTGTFGVAAIAVGISLLLSLAVEAGAGPKLLFRTDILLLIALYGLTFFEFLFPQPDFSNTPFGYNAVPSSEAAGYGVLLTLLGFFSIALGRHFVGRASLRAPTVRPELAARTLLSILVLVAIVGYFHILYAVSFNPFEALKQMAWPRFSQSWARGKLGGWYSLVYELGALIYLIPPLAAMILQKRKSLRPHQVLVVLAILLVTLYSGFVGGTRSIFVLYVLTFIGTYFLSSRRVRLGRMILLGLPAAAIVLASIYFMVEFRKIGAQSYDYSTSGSGNFSVDYNLLVISRLTEVFPDARPYLGFEIPYNAIIRPIPRAVWPGKPEGLSVGIEEALGASGLTLAATFVGEAYMSGGAWAVVFTGLVFGAAAARWNRVGIHVRSNLDLAIYVSGFLSGLMAMRSPLAMVPMMLPTIALWMLGKWASKRSRRASAQEVGHSVRARLARSGRRA